MISFFRKADSKGGGEKKTAEIKDEFKPMRTVGGPLNWGLMIAGFSLALFHLYTGFFGAFSAMNQRAVHWLVISVMVFFLYAARGAAI